MAKAKAKMDFGGMKAWKFWLIAIGMGLAGQICWNIENQWFNTFVYAKISGDVNIVSAMVIISALMTTASTFFFGTLSDRMGKRKFFVSIGYILWGVTTIGFGLTEYLRGLNDSVAYAVLLASLVVIFDAVMSFFGSMGNDSGYNTWLNDYTNDTNKGLIGALLASLPVLGTVLGTILGGQIVNIGNPTVGTEAYDPSKDNYQLLFWIVGGFIILCGVVGIFLVKEHPSLKPTRDGGFFHQFGNVFNFKKLKGIANGKELLFACLTVTMFFIPFNFYFTHMGNWMIYDLGFTAGNMGLVEGIALLAAVLCTLPFSVLINKNKIPFVALLGVISNALGLLLIFLLVKDKNSVDGANLLSLKNLPAIGCVFLIGLGYVLIMETTMIWMKTLFPKEALGQFEGVRILFFVLIPMFLGTIIGNIVIKNTPQPLIDGKPLVDAYGVPIDVPQENMFLYASILSVLTLVPLFFGWRLYKKRYGAKAELPQEEPPKEEE